MRIVGVVRTLNEDDIIEPVIRHHLAQLDAVLVLDDGSNDRTAMIVKSLISEGLPIELIERRCVIFDEGNRNTFLFERARDAHKADWVVFFDADEFLDTRLCGSTIKNYLNDLAGNVDGVQIRLVNYMDATSDEANEVNVAKRMVWRHKEPHDVYKIMLRATIGNVVVHAGNHNAHRNGVPLVVVQEPNIVLAHYPRRSGYHDIYKWVIGRLKITAAGTRETSQGSGTHYIAPFEILVNRPADLLKNEGFFNRSPDTQLMEKNPIDYLGAELRYTDHTDYKMKCISMILKYAMELSTEFGHLMDTNPDVQKRVAESLKL